MMVKRNDEEATKVLYKTSFISYSKTCSTVSNQTRIESKLKKKPSLRKGFYSDGNKLKRDLSIETDVCKLRRRCKQLLKLSNVDATSLLTSKSPKSAKSRFSNFTEIEPIEEFHQDFCGSGDNREASDNQLPSPYLVNKEDLLYNNLNNLVNTWVQQALEDPRLKNIIQNIFQGEVNKTEQKKAEISSSCMTYVLEKNNNRKKSTTSSGQCCSHSNNFKNLSEEQSSYILPSYNTIPIIYKTVRLISTLSIPRNMHKKEKRRKKKRPKKFKMKKGHHKKILVTMIQSKQYLVNRSDTNIELFDISTKSWLKKCANFDEKCIINEFNRENLYSTCHSSTEDAPYTVRQRIKNSSTHSLKPMPSLVDSVYQVNDVNCYDKYNSYDVINKLTCNKLSVEDFHNVENPYCKTAVKTSGILNENEQSDPMVSIDLFTQSFEYSTKKPFKPFLKIPHNNLNVKNNKIKCKKINKKPKFIAKKTTNLKIEGNKQTEDTHKAKKQIYSQNDLLHYLQEVLEYFENCETKNNVRLDIQVNVFPDMGVSRNCSGQHPKYFKKNPTFVYNISPARMSMRESQENKLEKPKIIPLLDGAASQAKYLFNIETSPVKMEDKTQKKAIKDQCSMTNDLGIKEELNEIKTALKHISILVHQCFPDQLLDPRILTKSVEIKTYRDSINNRNCPICKRDISKFLCSIYDNLPHKIDVKKLTCPYCKCTLEKYLDISPDTSAPIETILKRPSQNYEAKSPTLDIPRRSALNCDSISPTRKSLNSKLSSQNPEYDKSYKFMCSKCKEAVLKRTFLAHKDLIKKYLCPNCKDAISPVKQDILLKEKVELTEGDRDIISNISKYICRDCNKALLHYPPFKDTYLGNSNAEDLLNDISKILCQTCKRSLAPYLSRKNIPKCYKEIPSPPTGHKEFSHQNQNHRKSLRASQIHKGSDSSTQPKKEENSLEERENDLRKYEKLENTMNQWQHHKDSSNSALNQNIKDALTRSDKDDISKSISRCPMCSNPLKTKIMKNTLCGCPSSPIGSPLCSKNAALESHIPYKHVSHKNALLDRPSFKSSSNNYSICKCPTPEYDCTQTDIATPKQSSLKQKTGQVNESTKKRSLTIKDKAPSLHKHPSPGFQISNRMRILKRSGLKLSKEGRKSSKKIKKIDNSFESTSPMENLASYVIIESESVMQVTDMTSSVKRENTSGTYTDIGLTCSLPLTKSLYEVSCEKIENKKSSKSCKITSSDENYKNPNTNPTPSLLNTFIQDEINIDPKLGNTAQAVNYGQALTVFNGEDYKQEPLNTERSCTVNLDAEQNFKDCKHHRPEVQRLGPLTKAYYISWFIVLIMLLMYLLYEAKNGAFNKYFSKKERSQLNNTYLNLSELGF